MTTRSLALQNKYASVRDQIYYLLHSSDTIKTPSQLAKALDKKPQEINRWLNDFNNFTIETITKIETVFGKKIIVTPLETSHKMGMLYSQFEKIVNAENGIEISEPNSYRNVTTGSLERSGQSQSSKLFDLSKTVFFQNLN